MATMAYRLHDNSYGMIALVTIITKLMFVFYLVTPRAFFLLNTSPIKPVFDITCL